MPHSDDDPHSNSVLVRLRILATTDVHANLGAIANCGDDYGLIPASRLVEKLRAEVPNSLLFDNGDTIQGAPVGDAAADLNMHPHPVIAVMNSMGYDGATIGNHDFDYGVEFLKRSYSTASFPIVCGNLSPLVGGENFFTTRVLDLDVNAVGGGLCKLKVGLLGYVPPSVGKWHAQNFATPIEFMDILECARLQSRKLKDEGADIVVCLAHSGLGTPNADAKSDNVALQISQLPYVDVVIAGHDHRTIPPEKTFGSIPAIVQPGHSCKHIGVVDLELAIDGRGCSVAQSVSFNEPVKAKKRTSRDALSNKEIQRLFAHASTTIGKTKVPLHAYFSPLAPTPINQLMARAQRWYIARFFPQLVDLPILISTATPFSDNVRSISKPPVIPTGPVTIGDLYTLCPFNDNMVILQTTVAGIRRWIGHTFKDLLHHHQTEKWYQLDAPMSHGSFECVDGASFVVNLNCLGPSNRHNETALSVGPDAISGLKIMGQELEEHQPVYLATTTFRYADGSSYPIDGASRVDVPPIRLRKILLNYFQQSTADPIGNEGNWSFNADPGTRTLFSTTSKAMRFFDHLSHHKNLIRSEQAHGTIEITLLH